MPLLRAFTSAGVAACLALSAAAVHAAPRPSDEQFQSWLHHEVDGPMPWLIAPFESGPESVKVGHQVLEALWAEPDYRSHLHAWLDGNAAGADSSDELLSAWERHYHQVFDNSFEFQTDVRTSMLWIVEGGTGVAKTLPRAFCQSHTPDEIHRLRAENARAALAKVGDTIVKAMTQAMVREMQREDGKAPSRPDDNATMAKVAQLSLRATMATLPEDDSKRLYDSFAYGAAKVSAPEQCEREWVTSNAILTTQLSDVPKGISSGLLRQSIVQADFSGRLMRVDNQFVALDIPGFTPPRSPFRRPAILARNGARGVTTARLKIDAAGKLVDVAAIGAAQLPDRLATVDGAQVAASEPLLAALDRYLRAGSFAPRVVDGAAQPYEIETAIDWR